MPTDPDDEWTVDSAGARVPVRLLDALWLSATSWNGEWRWVTGNTMSTAGGLRFLACLEPDGQVSVSYRDRLCWMLNEAGRREEVLVPCPTDDVRLLRVRWFPQRADECPEVDDGGDE